VLIHGDFRNGNFMVTEKGLVAVLDWECSHIGSGIEDFGWISTRSWRFGSELPVGGFSERAPLYAAYTAAGGRRSIPTRCAIGRFSGWCAGRSST
jgi:aminoglycoside phosphotransferase (APT) family kinase protein